MSTGRFLWVAVGSRVSPWVVGWNIGALTLLAAGKPLTVGTVLSLVGV